MLEEGVSDHRHKRMTVKALPRSPLEVIEAKFFFHLLVSLLANPSRLDGGRQGVHRRFVGLPALFYTPPKPPKFLVVHYPTSNEQITAPSLANWVFSLRRSWERELL
jgi:hypothetical protein